jgi:metal-responsive CopG/Arc/MetJ family transcriptional regulator
MRTVQMTLDEELVETVDRIARKLKTTRSAFTREALREAIGRFNLQQLELKHRLGYEKYPVARDEFLVWEDEQDWGDE